MYNLTSLTGRDRNAGRTVIVNGFEFGRRALLVFGVAFAVALIPTIILSSMFGAVAMVLTPAVIITAAFVLVESRTRGGLKVRLYQSILDKKRAKTDEFYICWRPVSESLGQARIVSSSAPVASPSTTTAGPVFAGPATQARTRASIDDIMENRKK
jgi:hypothetical protein